jgi:hypothetical protein
MRVLVATSETQGERDGDYCWTVEGEMVRLPGLTCADPGCGCNKGWAGLSSSRATTTCKVVERDLDASELLATFTDAFAREGWLVAGEDTDWITDFAWEHRKVAEAFPVDTVLGIDNDNVINRGRAA